MTKIIFDATTPEGKKFLELVKDKEFLTVIQYNKKKYSLMQIADKIRRITGYDIFTLAGNYRGRAVSDARHAFLIAGKIFTNLTNSEISRYIKKSHCLLNHALTKKEHDEIQYILNQF